MWRRFDIGEIDEDFAHIAQLGLDTVRIFVRWDDFAPQPDTVDARMLERFGAVVESAAARHLRVLPVLFCGHMDGVNYLPAWALDRRRPVGRFRTITGEVPSPYACANLYAEPLLDAQVALCRALGQRLRGHPAIVAWDIGHAFTSVCEPPAAKAASGDHSTAPVAEQMVAQWSRRLCAAVRDTTALPVTAGTTIDDLTADRNIRLGSLCAPLDFASMQGDTVHAAFARGRRDPEAVPFLAMVAAAFSFKPVLVTGFGNPTCPPGKFSAFERFALPSEPPNLTISPDDTVFATGPCLSEDENAAYCTSVLERLHADGRLGALWWCWSDYTEEAASMPPFDLAPHARTYGIIRADGSEKPVAGALSAFAREARTVLRSADMPMIAAAYYYRTLPTSTATLYDAYLGGVAERRAAR